MVDVNQPFFIMNILALLYVLSGIISAVIIFFDQFVRGNRQQMKIMNVVWILTGLWAGAIGLIAYYLFGRRSHAMVMDMKMGMNMNMSKPKWQMITLSALHCGAGCSLADLIGEWFIFFVPISLISGWVLDYILALFIGLFFQYVMICAMEKITTQEAYKKAFKADFWSLTSWQVGMYGFMAVAIFGFDYHINRLSWEFWFLMQIAMMCGFLFSYPVNGLLIKKGIKKGM